LTRGDVIYPKKTSFGRDTKTAFYRSCFIFGPLIGAATHERHSVDNRLDHISVFASFSLFDCLDFFLPGSHVIPTLKLIGVGGLLPRMIFHRLEPMFDYPEKWDFPIYIYTVSLFLGFFRVF
jgi:hypothetical protein